ncbi:MAG: quinone oxidoreductase [Pseudomonadota bacterium]
MILRWGTMTEAYVIEMTETGGTEVLKKVAREPRLPGPGQALVRQTASGLNFIDTYHRTGLYPVKLPFVPGSEGAGVVEAVGEGVSNIAVGDRVAYLGSGTYSTHYTGAAATMVKLPEGVSEHDAAAVLLKGLTAWMLLFEVRRASPGETALVWAPVGGVGSLLVPWATSLGVNVIAVTSSETKGSRARELGAQHVILSSSDVAKEARDLTGGAGVDVSYDSVGKTSAQASIDSLKPRGWWVSYGNASGAAEPIAPGLLGAKGSLVLTRPGLFHFIADPDGLRRGAAALFGALRAGTIEAHVGQTFPLSDVAQAHEAIESGVTVGATLLLP